LQAWSLFFLNAETATAIKETSPRGDRRGSVTQSAGTTYSNPAGLIFKERMSVVSKRKYIKILMKI
jgi:hypothetical protein